MLPQLLAAGKMAWKAFKVASAVKAGAGALESNPDGAAVQRGSPRQAAMESLWTAEAAANMLERLWGMADGQFPVFNHAISVSVKGGPEADLRRIWYLCVSAAFGRYRNRSIGVQRVTFDATWDVTGKACSCTIGYADSGLISGAVRAATVEDGAPTSGLMLLQQGPDQVTIGGAWPGFLWTTSQSLPVGAAPVFGGGLFGNANDSLISIIPGLPVPWLNLLNGTARPPVTFLRSPWEPVTQACSGGTDSISFMQSGWGTIDVLKEAPRRGGFGTIFLPWRRVYPVAGGRALTEGSSLSAGASMIPLLPDNGRIITTGEKRDARVQPPRPQLDGRSRNSMVQLVAQYLQTPCFHPQPPPCKNDIIGTPGLRVHAPEYIERGVFLNTLPIQQAVSPSRFNGLGSIFSYTWKPEDKNTWILDGYGPPVEAPNVGR